MNIKNNNMEENKKQGQEPAFAYTYGYLKDGQHHVKVEQGMSKRFYAACAAMQGILANTILIDDGFVKPELIAEFAYKCADEILKQENK